MNNDDLKIKLIEWQYCLQNVTHPTNREYAKIIFWEIDLSANITLQAEFSALKISYVTSRQASRKVKMLI